MGPLPKFNTENEDLSKVRYLKEKGSFCPSAFVTKAEGQKNGNSNDHLRYCLDYRSK